MSSLSQAFYNIVTVQSNCNHRRIQIIPMSTFSESQGTFLHRIREYMPTLKNEHKTLQNTALRYFSNARRAYLSDWSSFFAIRENALDR